jgi:nucleotide-binding universal stress UspA family protein
MITLKNILVAIDFSEPSEAALMYGRELAGRFGATLHVLHAVQDIYIGTFGAGSSAALAPELQQQIEDGARRRVDELVVDSDRSAPTTVTTIVTSSSPALSIVDYARDHKIDVIVIGTHGRGALAHLMMGSVAERVVRLAPCPVLTVHHPEREFVRPDTVPAVTHAI